MSREVARRLSEQGVEIFIRTSPYLHAKLYHLEYSKGYFRTFVGSANFTIGGLERNHELMAEMEGVGDASACHREIERMQLNQGAVPYAAWVHNGQPQGEEEVK